MTTVDEHAAGPDAPARDSRLTDLTTLDPWTSLRPVTGMLLGVEDFETLVEHPHAKQLLHNAWWHGPGVLHGFDVRSNGLLELEVLPGLAVDAAGRELHLDHAECLSIKDLIPQDADYFTVWVVLRYDACLAGGVVVLADPCDVTRSSTQHTRILERAVVTVTADDPGNDEDGTAPYRRVRMLLGLEPLGQGPADRVVREHRDAVADAAPADRPARLAEALRCLAALDSVDLTPAGDPCESRLPVDDDEHAGVVLACATYTVEHEGGKPVVRKEPEIDLSCRSTVLPTTVIQELVCGLAPALLGAGGSAVGTAPQVVADSLDWGERAESFSFKVTADLAPGSLKRAVHVSSLSDSEWVVEDLAGPPRYDKEHRRVVVRLADRPANPLVRVVVLGTGRTPVYGASPPVPLAGVDGEDAGAHGQGRDAVLTVPNPAAAYTERS